MSDSTCRQSDLHVDIFSQKSLLSAPSLWELGTKAFFRTHEASELGVDSDRMRLPMNDGTIDRMAPGPYRPAEAEQTEPYTKAAPGAQSQRGEAKGVLSGF